MLGEENHVVASVEDNLLTVQDAGASITAGDGCDVVTIHEVTCTAPGMLFRLKDKADTFTGISGDGWLVLAGRGDDTLVDHCQRFCGLLDGDEGSDYLVGTNLEGGEGADTMIGTPSVDRLVGGAGKDTLLGLGAHDNLQGGRGPDYIDGGPGSDWIFAGSGDDKVFGGVGGGRDQLWGMAGADRLDGGDGDDRLDGDHNPGDLDFGEGPDLLLGRGGDDRFNAKDGIADRIRGGPGSDLALVDPDLDIWISVQTIV